MAEDLSEIIIYPSLDAENSKTKNIRKVPVNNELRPFLRDLNISTYGHQMVYMHICDYKADGKWTEAVGDGVIDFAGIAAALKKDFRGRAAIELAFDAPRLMP